MILPDVNLLLYAHYEAAPQNVRARAWWEGVIDSRAPVGLAWAVVVSFVRLVTQPAVFRTPLTPAQALDRVDAWFEHDNVVVLEPGPRHLRIVRDLFAATGVAAGLTTDTHLAALAIEHRAEVHTNDHDFERFPGLRLRFPLA